LDRFSIFFSIAISPPCHQVCENHHMANYITLNLKMQEKWLSGKALLSLYFLL
jgi:hypothetical protein